MKNKLAGRGRQGGATKPKSREIDRAIAYNAEAIRHCQVAEVVREIYTQLDKLIVSTSADEMQRVELISLLGLIERLDGLASVLANVLAEFFGRIFWQDD